MLRLRRSEAIYVNALGGLLIVIFCVTAEEPARKWPIGKETTYITEPLDDEGYIDYETALNDRLSKGVTPEKNANVLIWKALGPRPEGGDGMPAAYFKRLGIEQPPDEGSYFINLRRFAKTQLEFNPDQVDLLDDQAEVARQRPWSPKDNPNLVTWLSSNEKPLALIIEATSRPDYFNPLISGRGPKGRNGLIGALLPTISSCRAVANALVTRAMLRIQENQFDEAWKDLLACHRLSRLISRGGTLEVAH
ncbi:MAG TPA: hypothetical protein VGZ25_11000 [Gemmataceae bacterium]|jgi:hypothetical protein|nr:hypothetical protein [Gemmataceae bacterium]